MVQYPVFADAVKSQVMHHDLGGEPPKNSFSPVAALAGAFVAAKQEGEHESWGSAWLTSDDLDELKDVQKAPDASALVFPGLVKAYSKDSTALGQAGEGKGKTQVLFKFKGKVYKPAGDNVHVMYR